MSSNLVHLIKDFHTHSFCLYCGADKDLMKSEFQDDFHYLSFVCNECMRKNFVKVDFLSSGINFRFDKKKPRNALEEIIIKNPVLR